MSGGWRGALWGLLGGAVGVLLAAAACGFHPDLSRFPACDAQGGCPPGSTCLAPQGICLPDCGERGPCPSAESDGGTPDAGPGSDGGTDAGTGTDGGSDAGTDGGAADGGTDGGTATVMLSASGPGNAVETVSFSHRFQASGGTPPYAFSSVGALPAGLALDTQGELSGTPPSAGDFPLTVEVVDHSAAPQRDQRGFTLHVLPLLRVAGPSILADVPSGKAYAEQVSAVGGTPPYRFELAVGSALPSGIVLYNTGRAEGTSSGSGTTFEVRVSDSGAPAQVATRALQVTVSSCSFLCMRTRSVPDARVGTAYAYNLQASSGTGSLTWKLESGTLPPGLQLDAATGLLSGTPTQPGTYDFTASVADMLLDKKIVALSMVVF